MSDIDPTTGRRTATDKRPHVRMTAGYFTDPGKLSHIADPVERMATLALHAAAIGLSRELGSDGHIRPEVVLERTGLPPQYAKALMTDDVWHQADHGCPRCPQPRLDHVYLHDILEHQRTAEQEKRVAERMRSNGAKGLAARWDGHQKPEKTKRPPGRPRKNPKPQEAAEPVGGERQVALVEVDPAENEQVLQHPAETRARAKRGRPKTAEPRVFEPIVVDLCNHFADWRQRNDPDGKRPNVTERWLNSCRLMIEVDGRDPEKIRKAIDYSQGDEFCRIWVQAMPKLREEYGRLQDRAKLDRSRARRGNRRSVGAAPAALPATGMASMLARQMGGAQGGMVKGA